MEGYESEKTYIDILVQGLSYKVRLLDQLMAQTKIQEELLKEESFNMNEFELTMEQKSHLLMELSEADEGFGQLYSRVSTIVKNRKEDYKQDILKMQELIQAITEKGVLIRALENQNQGHLDQYTRSERSRIREYKISSKTAANYYKTMTKQSSNSSYFMDKKS